MHEYRDTVSRTVVRSYSDITTAAMMAGAQPCMLAVSVSVAPHQQGLLVSSTTPWLWYPHHSSTPVSRSSNATATQ